MTFGRTRAAVVAAALLPLDALAVALMLLTDVLCAPLRWMRRPPPSFVPPRRDSVTIQILNWDGRTLLEECLPRLREAVALAGGGHRIVVVDNGSRDDSVALVRERFPEVHIVQLDRNYGFSEGNNRGMASAGSDIVVILNNDMVVDPHFLRPLLEPFCDPSVFAVTSQIFLADPAARREETGRTRARFEGGLFYMWHEDVHPAVETIPTAVFWAGGGSSAVDRRKYEVLGGFDTLYHPFYVEDVDLSYRAWKRGWRSLFAPESHVTHRHRASSKRFGTAFIDNTIRRNHFLFVWKNVTDIRMIAAHLVRMPRNHAQSVLERGMAFEFRAYMRAWMRLPRTLTRRLAECGAGVLDDRAVIERAQ
jgi:GT2 family glycosyltransferase